MNTEFTSDTPTKKEVLKDTLSLKISEDGYVENDDIHFIEIMKDCGFYDDSANGNLFTALIAKADAHNPFAVKMLEGVEAVLLAEFDAFQIVCPAGTSGNEKMYNFCIEKSGNEAGLVLNIIESSAT